MPKRMNQRLQRRSGLSRSFNIRDAAAVQYRCGSNNDKPGGKFRKKHADKGINPHIFYKFQTPCVRNYKLAEISMIFNLFNLLSCLPKKQIRRNGCAQHAGNNQQELKIKLDTREKSCFQNFQPMIADY